MKLQDSKKISFQKKKSNVSTVNTWQGINYIPQ